MLECLGDVGSTVPALGRSLVRAQLGLNVRCENAGEVSAKEAAETCRELKGPHARRVLGAWAFEDPDEEVDGVAKDLVKLVV